MTVSFNKASIAVAATLAVLVLANVADAAVSLGYPKGRPYFGSDSGQSAARSYRNFAPSQSAADDTRQSFSYEPSEEADSSQIRTKGCCCGGDHASQSDARGDVASKPEETRRSYSYEPESQGATQQRFYSRRTSRVGEPWQYQKTDPRRMGN